MIKYEYLLKRSARRSVSVIIKDDNSLVVHAPLRMSVSEIEKFLLSKSAWIDKHLRRHIVENSGLSDIISYKKILVSGVPVKLSVGERNAVLQDEVQVKSLKNLKKLYVDNFGGQFLKLFEEICSENNFTYGSVSFKDYMQNGACCARAGIKHLTKKR